MSKKGKKGWREESSDEELSEEESKDEVIGIETESDLDSEKEVRKAKRSRKKEVKEESVKHLAPVDASAPKSIIVDNSTPILDLTAASQTMEDETDKENSDEVNMNTKEFVEDMIQSSALPEPKTMDVLKMELERNGVKRKEVKNWVDEVIGYRIGIASRLKKGSKKIAMKEGEDI